MRDPHSGQTLYSHCYSTLFREYRSTPEGATTTQTFEETVLLPMPKHSVQIAFQQRDATQQFRDATVVNFDPAQHHLLTRSHNNNQHIDLEIHGAPSHKIDIAIVAQGYHPDSTQQLNADYHRMTEILFGKDPFASHRTDFNVYGISAEVGAQYGTFGIERYLMTLNLWQLHDALGTTPCDYIIIMVNNQRYGGGAIYNLYAVSSLHQMAEYVLPHELGHAFGGLADEYVDESLSYNGLYLTTAEPTEPNITNLVNFPTKWANMLPANTPVPTPDNPDIPPTECGPLGVYAGAGYSATAVYRPAMHCMMRDYAPFCPVCMKRLEEIFKLHTQ